MSIGWQIDDLIDNGHYDGMNTGWYFRPSYKNSSIPFSKRGSVLFSKLETGHAGPTVTNLENILFIRPNDPPEIKSTKIELVFEWKYITENRKNLLISLRKKLSFEGSKASADVSLRELDEAYTTIMEIISKEPEIWFPKHKAAETDTFINNYAEDLLQRLLEFIKRIEDEKQIKAIIADMKFLTAILLGRKNESGDYECSTFDYVNYLKDRGIDSISKECRECFIGTRFTDYVFCLCCGKRIL